MDDLRQKAIDKGIPSPIPDVLTFHKTFIKDIERRGRVHELRMMGEFNVRSGKPFHNVAIAPKMLRRKRLPLLPPKARKGFRAWMRRLRKKS